MTWLLWVVLLCAFANALYEFMVGEADYDYGGSTRLIRANHGHKVVDGGLTLPVGEEHEDGMPKAFVDGAVFAEKRFNGV